MEAFRLIILQLFVFDAVGGALTRMADAVVGIVASALVFFDDEDDDNETLFSTFFPLDTQNFAGKDKDDVGALLTSVASFITIVISSPQFLFSLANRRKLCLLLVVVPFVMLPEEFSLFDSVLFLSS